MNSPAENEKRKQTEEDEDTSQDPSSNAVKERLSSANFLTISVGCAVSTIKR
jgi:hypothetical protein